VLSGLTTSKTPSIGLLDNNILIVYNHQLLETDNPTKKFTPPYGLTFPSFTDDVGVVDKKTKTHAINAGPMNGYLIISGIVFNLCTKLQKGVTHDHLGQGTE
jgi:hypothetical protein